MASLDRTAQIGGSGPRQGPRAGTHETAATYRTEELAERARCSEWLLYQTVRDGTCPFPFVKVGRRVLFIRSKCDEILGIAAPPEPIE